MRELRGVLGLLRRLALHAHDPLRHVPASTLGARVRLRILLRVVVFGVGRVGVGVCVRPPASPIRERSGEQPAIHDREHGV